MPQEGVERRLAALLAADMVGYSRLMGEDEAGTLAALTSHREALREDLRKAGVPEGAAPWAEDFDFEASAKAVVCGYKRVYYFSGGFPAWKGAGYPIETYEGY